MSADIVLHEIHGVFVGVQPKDGYLNATRACEAYFAETGIRKQPGDWLKTDRAKAYIAYVASVTNIVVTDLVVTRRGGNPNEQGTWLHPDLAPAFGTWLSVELEYRLTKIIQQWRSEPSDSAEQLPTDSKFDFPYSLNHQPKKPAPERISPREFACGHKELGLSALELKGHVAECINIAELLSAAIEQLQAAQSRQPATVRLVYRQLHQKAQYLDSFGKKLLSSIPR